MLDLQLPYDGYRGALQVMPLQNFGSTSGADDIDVSNMQVIEFDVSVTVYKDSASTATFTVAANKPYSVVGVNSIHVSAAVNYLYG